MFKKVLFFICLFFSIALIMPRPNFSEDAIHKAVMIISNSNFRDEELLVTKEILEDNNIKVTLASSSLAPATGMLGSVIKPDVLLPEIQIDDYDAIIFVGGSGADEFWNDIEAHKLAQQAVSSEKIIAAICIAPVILAKAGILKGKKSTVWTGVSQELIANGAIYRGNKLETDGNIITAMGPKQSREFAEAIVEVLFGRRKINK